MDFGPYEVFSVITGVVLLLCAAAPELTVRNRVSAVLSGAFFIGYGFYVASQDTGTFEFPVFIFVVPFLAVGYLLYRAFSGDARTAPSVETAPPRHVPGPAGSVRTTPDRGRAPQDAPERRCVNRDCDFYGRATRRTECLRCERRTQIAPGAALDATTPVPVRRFAHLETRWCAADDCADHLVRTSDLLCRRCRRDTATA